MATILQKALSYFWPIKVAQFPSKISGTLELILNKGKLMLDTETANYSYGNLHAVMKAAIAEVHTSKNTMQNVLILGFGGGDAAHIIRKHAPKSEITGVELDEEVIGLYKKHFELPHVKVVKSEAQRFLNESKNRSYDLIICDVFINLDKPPFTQSKMYYQSIKAKLGENGIFVQNLMFSGSEAKLGFAAFKEVFPEARSSSVLEKNYLFFSS